MSLLDGVLRRPMYRGFVTRSTDDIDSPTEVQLTSAIQQNESLETLTSMTLTADLANYRVNIKPGDPFRVTMGGFGSEAQTSQFNGFINKRGGVSYPNTVRLTAVGPLGKLLTRAPENDHDLTGMTDGEAVAYILDQCGVEFDPDDIYGSDVHELGYELGAVLPIVWLAGTPGADMIHEIDSVMGFTTLEVGSGRIIRFAYSLTPNDPDFGYANADVTATFSKGNSRWYYEGERDYGDNSTLQNYWRVTGLRYTCNAAGALITDPEADDTCQCEFWATALAENPDISGYSAPQSFSSDIIQHEGLAKMIAIREIQNSNRNADIVTIVTANNPRINPGDVVGLQDNSWGMDLTGVPKSNKYLIMSLDRQFDMMTLNCVGGIAGDPGTVHSGIAVCCGTQKADLSCDDSGSDGSATDPPEPTLPPDPDYGDFEPPEYDPEQNSEDPIVCDDLNPNINHSIGTFLTETTVETNLRPMGGTWEYGTGTGDVPLPGDALATIVNTGSGGTLVFSDVFAEPGDLDGSTDTVYGPGTAWAACVDVGSCISGTVFQMLMLEVDDADLTDDTFSTAGQASGASWYFDDVVTLSTSIGDQTFDVHLHLENGQATTPAGLGEVAPTENSPSALRRNTGVYFPYGGGSTGLPVQATQDEITFNHLCAGATLGDDYPKVMCYGDGGSYTGYSEAKLAFIVLGPYSCDKSHKLALTSSGAGGGSFEVPNLVIAGFAFGSVNCIENPNYQDPTVPDDEADEPDTDLP